MLRGIKSLEKNFSALELPTLDFDPDKHSLPRSLSCDEITDISFWESSAWNEAAEKTSEGFLEEVGDIEIVCNPLFNVVATYFKKVSQFIPLREVEDFGYTKASLACVFDKIGFSFAFLPEVRDILVKYLGEFEGFSPMIPMEFSAEMVVEACVDLLQVVDANLETVHDKSLKELWKQICAERKLKDDFLNFSATQIRDYLENPESADLRHSVSLIDLRCSTIQILPPEILLFKNLQELILDGSEIHETPHILFSIKNIKIYQYEDGFWRCSNTATWQSRFSNPFNSCIGSSSIPNHIWQQLNNKEILDSQMPSLGGLPSSSKTDLEIIWSRVIYNYPMIPSFGTQEKILTWLDNPSNAELIAEIKVLDLSNLGLTEIPDAIVKFTHLEELNLSQNWINKLPETIGNLRELSKLYLFENEFTEIPPVIQKLSKLKTLDMSTNRLESIPDWFCTCKKIKKIYLQDNKISSLPNLIGNLENLKVLNLEDNQLTNLPSSIKDLSKLEILAIVGNPSLHAIPDQLHFLNLNEFYCDRDLYNDIPKGAFIAQAYFNSNKARFLP